MPNLHTTTVELFPTAPFDFAKSVAFLGEFMPAAGEQNLDRMQITENDGYDDTSRLTDAASVQSGTSWRTFFHRKNGIFNGWIIESWSGGILEVLSAGKDFAARRDWRPDAA